MRFLLCVDGSEDSSRAIEHLRRIVKEKDEVFLLHAWKPLDLPPSVQMIGPLPIVSQFPQFPYLQLKERRFVENESHHILLASAKQLIGENAELDDQVWTVSREAKDPKDAIVAEAEARHIDLIVMGRRGLGPLQQMFVGSNSLHVLESAHCPVMIVH
jgi:nucleotide-binding universal stress UspA family protein